MINVTLNSLDQVCAPSSAGQSIDKNRRLKISIHFEVRMVESLYLLRNNKVIKKNARIRRAWKHKINVYLKTDLFEWMQG